MSYILDALKKSELQRNGEDLPEWNQEEVTTSSSGTEKNYRVTVGILVVLIPVLVGLIYWIFFKPSDDLPVASLAVESELAQLDFAPTIELEDETPVTSASTAPESTATPTTPPTSTKKSKKISLRDFNKAQGREEKQASVVTAGKSKARSSVIFSKEPLELEPASLGKFSPKVKVDNTVVSVFELPESIQRSLPELLFSGHVYSSDNSKRHIMINASRLREGDSAAAGITLDKITITGAEFTYKNRRFSLNALQDWDGLR